VTTHIHAVPRLKVHGAVPPDPSMPSQHTKGQLTFHIA